ncbi:hypothetical protein RHSIM_Rhsim08G0075200 [Rhododendron simsii]|uniref:Uncharacterized protein n=1 Tax=Rhododendron simsii TaxID=118357 RepID=A0A834GL06_RHOSS|nr:hypothetical protein RHSIM_Rhsim08G0075200 [Rhododendron simsii]
MTSAAKSLLQTLRRYIKKPWEITGPVAGPEYMDAVPKATEYRVFCPATVPQKAIIPNSDPETVFDIKYFSRDQRRNRPPIGRTVLKKADVVKMMRETSFDVNDFPRVYLTDKVEEDMNAIGGGSVELGEVSVVGATPYSAILCCVCTCHVECNVEFFEGSGPNVISTVTSSKQFKASTMGTSQSLIMKRRELVSVCASPTAVHQLLDRSGGLDEVEALTPTPVTLSLNFYVQARAQPNFSTPSVARLGLA